MKTTAAVAYADKDDFQIEEIEIEAPRANEILVKIVGVGICHTDITFAGGGTPFPLPAVLGHEGAGIVEAIGEDVKKVQVGDRVMITFGSCGACDRCGGGDPAYCRVMPLYNYAGRRQDGSQSLSNEAGKLGGNFFGQSSFANHALTYERNVVKVDEDLPLEIMGPLGCGVQTGAGAMLRSLGVEAGTSVLITGGGSVGLSAVMGAKIAGCKNIVVAELMETRRNLAIEFGATHVIDPASVPSLSGAVRTVVPLGVDYALDTTGVPGVQKECVDALGSKGALGVVGVTPMGTPPPGDMNMLMTFGKSIHGIIEGDSNPDEFLPELMDHFREGRLPFDKMVKTYNLRDINQAIADTKSGECVKAVLLTE